MYETLMEVVVADENCQLALEAVVRNQGAAGIDRMTTAELEPHLQAHWGILKDKLLKGSYVPTPVRRVEIPKPSGGTRMLGIPTVQDRFIQQLLLQALTPIFDPQFSEHSYGFRPGRSAQDAVRAAQQYAQEGKEWVVDIDITKFFDHVNHDILMGRIARVIRDKRVLHLIGEYLRRGPWWRDWCKPAWKARRKAGRYRRCWRTSIWMTWIRNWIGGGMAIAGMRTTAISTSAVRPRRNARWPRYSPGSRNICD
jgi:hypothetical protein